MEYEGENQVDEERPEEEGAEEEESNNYDIGNIEPNQLAEEESPEENQEEEPEGTAEEEEGYYAGEQNETPQKAYALVASKKEPVSRAKGANGPKTKAVRPKPTSKADGETRVDVNSKGLASKLTHKTVLSGSARGSEATRTQPGKTPKGYSSLPPEYNWIYDDMPTKFTDVNNFVKRIKESADVSVPQMKDAISRLGIILIKHEDQYEQTKQMLKEQKDRKNALIAELKEKQSQIQLALQNGEEMRKDIIKKEKQLEGDLVLAKKKQRELKEQELKKTKAKEQSNSVQKILQGTRKSQQPKTPSKAKVEEQGTRLLNFQFLGSPTDKNSRTKTTGSFHHESKLQTPLQENKNTELKDQIAAKKRQLETLRSKPENKELGSEKLEIIPAIKKLSDIRKWDPVVTQMTNECNRIQTLETQNNSQFFSKMVPFDQSVSLIWE
jgi:hypothetical protein